MNRLKRTLLYAAVGAAVVLGTAGCKRDVSLEPKSKLEYTVKAEEAPAVKQESPTYCPLTELEKSCDEFSKQLDETIDALEEAMEFEAEYQKEMAKLAAEELAARGK
jgi:hypothetical protein